MNVEGSWSIAPRQQGSLGTGAADYSWSAGVQFQVTILS